MPFFHQMRDFDRRIRLRNEETNGVIEREFIGKIRCDNIAEFTNAGTERVGNFTGLGNRTTPENFDFMFAIGAFFEFVNEPLGRNRLCVAGTLRLEGQPFIGFCRCIICKRSGRNPKRNHRHCSGCNHPAFTKTFHHSSLGRVGLVTNLLVCDRCPSAGPH